MAPGRRLTIRQNPPVNCSTNQNNVDINKSQFGISNVAKGDRVKFASSTLLDGALTWWNVYVHSVTLDSAHATPWMKGTNLTAYNQRFQELILLCPEMVPNADRLLERYIEGLPLSIKGNVTSSKPVDLHESIDIAQGLMFQVVQELGESSGDKRKWNGNHYTHNPNNTSNFNPNKRPETARVFTADKVLMLASYLTAESVDDTTLTHALLLVTTVGRQDIRPKTVELHLVL
ncbi:hypothetical protein Tco_0035039 [Tanacetum coccineum]